MNNVDNQSIPHFFIYDEGGVLAPEKRYSFGNMAIENKRLLKRNIWAIPNPLFQALEGEIAQLRPEKSGLIVYIHGYQADNIFFMQKSGYTIQDKVFDCSSLPYGLALSLQWSSVIPYHKAVDAAYEKGSQFASFMVKISDLLHVYHPQAPISFICHSMGNRVFQGLYETWLSEQSDMKINQIFFMAADLESDIFERGLQDLGVHSQLLHVYFNQQDFTLKIANAMMKHPRLGIYGVREFASPKNCLQYDVTGLEDDRSFIGNLMHHRYFYGSKTVRDGMIEHLSKR